MRTLYVMEYDFHIVTINLEVKPGERRVMQYEHIEDMLHDYREKKSALAYGFVPYNDNFHLYKATLEPMSTEEIEKLLQ